MGVNMKRHDSVTTIYVILLLLSSSSAAAAASSSSLMLLLHRVRKKRGHVIFDYKSRISWLIFLIFKPLETGTNTPQSV